MSDTKPANPTRTRPGPPEGSAAPSRTDEAPTPPPSGADAGRSQPEVGPPRSEDARDAARVAVRPADRFDAGAIGDILADVGVTQVLAEPDALTRQRLRAAIGDGSDAERPHAVWVAEIGARVVGFAAVSWTHNYRQGVDGLISDLFVHSAHRGNGAGTALLDAVRREAHAVGCQRLVLMSGKGGEAYAREFYPKQGFDEHDELACFMLPLPPEG